MTHRIHIIDLTTGKTICTQQQGFCSWDYIRECVAEWFSTPTLGYRRDDVHSDDDEDLIEYVTLDGKRVAKVEWVSDTRERFEKMHDETMTMLAAE